MALLLTEASFQGLLEAAPDAFIVVDAQGSIVLVNSQAEALFGYQRNALIGELIEKLIPARFHAVHTQHRSAYMDHPQTRPMAEGRTLVALRADGTEFYAEISLSPFPTAAETLVTAVIRDISDRKRAAEELERQVRERTAHLNVLLQFSGELLMARQPDAILQRALYHTLTCLTTAQHSAVYLYDQDAHMLQLQATSGVELLPPQQIAPHQGLIGAAWSSSQRQQGPFDQPDSAPDSLQMYMIAQPLIARTAVGVLVVGHQDPDISMEELRTLEGIANLTAAAIEQEQQRLRTARLSSLVANLEAQHQHMAERLTSAEAAMVQSARLAAMGQLAASIAHEINNPLYAVRNSLELLEDDLPTELKDSVYLGLARDQLQRIARIIERMRDFYRPPQGEFSAVDLHQIIAETLELAELHVRSGVDVQLIFQPAATLPRVIGVADQLRQVLLNLVLNALDAMVEGGTLTIQTELQDQAVVVSVRDNGIGIPAADLATIWEPFFTTKAHGTGLGLAITAHIIQHHQGRIDVKSTPHKGTTFFITLPTQTKGLV